MKRLSVLFSVLFASFTAHANIGLDLGVQLGSHDGLSVGYQSWDLGIKLDNFHVTLDHRFNSTFYDGLYFGAGALASNQTGETFGLRAKSGIAMQNNNIAFFAELIPNVTFGSRGGFNFDYEIGIRYRF